MQYSIVCPLKNNSEKKRLEKRTNYRRRPFEIKEREKKTGFKVKVVLLVISVLDGGNKEISKILENIVEKDNLCKKIVVEMQKIILMDSETIIQK